MSSTCHLPVLERNIIIDLDLVDDPDYIRLLKDRLRQSADLGIIERVQVRGKTAYRWREPEEAS